jgi:hypothetical protein
MQYFDVVLFHCACNAGIDLVRSNQNLNCKFGKEVCIYLLPVGNESAFVFHQPGIIHLHPITNISTHAVSTTHF